MTPRPFKCIQFRQSTLDFNLEFFKLFQNDFSKQRYITLNATSPGQDRIYPKTPSVQNIFAEYRMIKNVNNNVALFSLGGQPFLAFHSAKQPVIQDLMIQMNNYWKMKGSHQYFDNSTQSVLFIVTADSS